MSTNTCFVCEEYYQRDINLAMTLIPCGHVVCRPCITEWRKENNSCPECRKSIEKLIINRALMDLIEQNQKTNKCNANNPDTTPHHTTSSLTTKRCNSSSKDKNNEIISDKCEYAVYIIDNSKSMEYYCDGKIFEFVEHSSANKQLIKKSGVLRWHEAVSKIKKIASYNIKRKICASYYLLNPSEKGTDSWINSLNPFASNCNLLDWKENIDFIVIDARNDNEIVIEQKYKTLIQCILSENNIRGNTPLDVITHYFGRNLSKFVNVKQFDFQKKAVCFNIVTDGEPNNKNKFEKELRYLANTFNIFLVINLCTDCDEIVEYYNDLDTKIGAELSGFDVLDDLESEQREVLHAGNDFFVYSEAIHICRMAGCYSIIGDLMDEKKLSVYHACKLCNELCGIHRFEENDELPNYNDRKRYIECIKTMIATKNKVYDFKQKRLSKIIDVNKLDYLIWINEPCDNQIEYVYKLMVYNYPIIIFVIIVLFVVFKI